MIVGIFFELFQFDVVLLNPSLKSLPSFSHWQIQLVGLEFEIFLLFDKNNSFFFQMLCSLFQSILAKSLFCLCKSSIHIFKFIPRIINVLAKHNIFFLQFFIVVSLFWVQIIKFRLILKVYVLNLRFMHLNFVFHVSFFRK